MVAVVVVVVVALGGVRGRYKDLVSSFPEGKASNGCVYIFNQFACIKSTNIGYFCLPKRKIPNLHASLNNI